MTQSHRRQTNVTGAVVDHEIGTVQSGDVSLFYRHVGTRGAAPVIILHGGNYYDSIDWLPIAAGIAQGREVVAYDQRGMGNSTFSPSKNYSDDAVFDDVLNLMNHCGWDKAVILGQSRNAGRALKFAANFPERAAGVILADSIPGSGPPPGAGAHRPVGSGAKVYATLEDALSEMSNDKAVPEGSHARKRMEEILQPVDGGFVVATRDPDMDSAAPIDQPGWQTRFPRRDPWEELMAVPVPVLVLHARESKSCKPEALERIARDFPDVEIATLESGHDLPAQAASAVVKAVSHFLASRVDAA